MTVSANLAVSDIQGLSAQGASVWQEAQASSQGDLTSMLALGTLLAENVPPSTAEQALSAGLQVASGAAAGAAAGSVIPGYGTVIGAAVGAIIAAVQVIGQGGGPHSTTEGMPPYLVAAMSGPTPKMPDGSDPPESLRAAAGDLYTWQMARFGRAPMINGPSVWGYPSHPDKGSVVEELGNYHAAIDALSRFARWVENYQPIWLPEGNPSGPVPGTDGFDPYGWSLQGAFWIMAVQGNSDLDALHFCLAQQWIMYTMGGPSPEPHLAYMIGRLSMLVAQDAGQAGSWRDRFGAHLERAPMVIAQASKGSAERFLLPIALAGIGAVTFGVLGAAVGAVLGYVAERRIQTS